MNILSGELKVIASAHRQHLKDKAENDRTFRREKKNAIKASILADFTELLRTAFPRSYEVFDQISVDKSRKSYS